MKNKNVLVTIAILAAIGLLAFFVIRDAGDGGDSTPKPGVVTEVNLDNWKSEVDDQEANTPVLVFFSNSSVDAQQLDVVKLFAGKNAGKVKVVIVNCDDRNVLVLASKYDVSAFPSFRVLYQGAAHKLDGHDGKAADDAALQQLLDKTR